MSRYKEMRSIHQPLRSEVIQAGLSLDAARWLKELDIHLEIDSTNTHLMKRAAAEAIDGIVCIAERQTHGRGRRGRTWLTPAGGNIALSLGASISVAMADVAPLSLVVGVAVADALERSGVTGVSLKWPNDILLDGNKLGGILIEIVRISRPLDVVIGVGINVGSNVEIGARLGLPVGDALDRNLNVSRNDLVAALINSIHDLMRLFEAKGFASMRSEWEALHAHQHHGVRLISASESVAGVARGVTDNGEIILETEQGVRHFSAGEVSLRGEY